MGDMGDITGFMVFASILWDYLYVVLICKLTLIYEVCLLVYCVFHDNINKKKQTIGYIE